MKMNGDLLEFALNRASDEAIRDVIGVLDRKFNELYDESEQLEKLDLVVELDQEQRSRARYLEETITILTALMDRCYDFIKEKDGAENA